MTNSVLPEQCGSCQHCLCFVIQCNKTICTTGTYHFVHGRPVVSKGSNSCRKARPNTSMHFEDNNAPAEGIVLPRAARPVP